MRIRPAVLGTIATLLLAGGLLPACGKEKATPGLMLSFTSDMSVPKDVTAVGLYIRTKTGGVIYNNVVEATVDASGNRTVRFPSTFAILSNGSAATVRVQLIAYGKVTTSGGTTNRKAIVMRESTTGVPTDRLSLLRMPLLWINQGSVSAGSGVTTTAHAPAGLRPLANSVTLLADEAQYRPEDGYKSPCGENQSWIGGKCRTIDPNAPLPDFTEADKPGLTGGVCFSVESCFATPTSLREKIRDDGSLDIGTTRPTAVNLALITKDEIGIKLPDGRFAISLDSDSEFEGFTIEKDRIVLSDAVREALKSGRAVDLVATSSCGPKTADIVNCGPWNPATQNVETRPPVVIGDDGGTPIADASSDALLPGDGGPDARVFPPQGEAMGPSEPQYSGLFVSLTTLYAVRDGAPDGGNSAGIRLTAKVDPAPKTNTGIPNGGAMLPGPYRVEYMSFDANANSFWANKSWVFAITKGGTSQGHIYFHEVGSNTFAELQTVPGFLPLGGVPSPKMPMFAGPRGVTPSLISYTDATIYQTVNFIPGLSVGETPTATLSTGPGGFRLGTASTQDSKARVRNCVFNGPLTEADCSSELGVLSQGVPVDLAEDGKLYALVVRNADPEQSFEGVYEVSGGSMIAQATRGQFPGADLHFELGESGATAGTGPRNRIALPKGQPSGFFSTKSGGGAASQILRFDRGASPIAPTPFAKQLSRALDVQADESHVYYIDYGTSPQKADGFIYRLPWK